MIEAYVMYTEKQRKCVSWESNLLCKLIGTCYMVGLIGLLPFFFFLHFLSIIPDICVRSAKAGIESDFLTVLVSG